MSLARTSADSSAIATAQTETMETGTVRQLLVGIHQTHRQKLPQVACGVAGCQEAVLLCLARKGANHPSPPRLVIWCQRLPPSLTAASLLLPTQSFLTVSERHIQIRNGPVAPSIEQQVQDPSCYQRNRGQESDLLQRQGW